MAIINYLPYGGVPAPEKIFKFEYTGEAVYSETGNDEWELEFDSSGSFTPYEAATVDIFIVGGGGGGRPNLAQAGGKKPEGLPEALKAAEKWLAEK